jgi:hypothetical protein
MGWDSPGSSLDGLLAVTAASELPPGSAGLSTMAASRARPHLDVFMTPMPQPDWLEGDEGVASSSKSPGSCGGAWASSSELDAGSAAK